jgi:DNA-binding SARP family transcriptional activator
VGSRKARTLLALLTVEHGRTVPMDRLVLTLWERTPPTRPAENVATLVSRLRTRLGPGVIVGDRSGYRLGEAPRVDLFEAASLVGMAERDLSAGEAGPALARALAALALIDDAVILADHPSAAWSAPAHALHAGLLRRGRGTVAEAALLEGDPRTAVEAAEAAVRADPLDEAAFRLLMSAYEAGNEPARALLAYERLRRTLDRELGVSPAPATRDLHTAILLRNSSPA